MTKKIKQKTKKSKDGLSYEEFYKKKKKMNATSTGHKLVSCLSQVNEEARVRRSIQQKND